MRLQRHSSIGFIGLAAALLAPLGALAADAPSASAGITLNATRAVGAEAVTITGKAPATQPLEALLYVRFSQDLPTVLLSRRPVPTDGNGNYNVTLSIASAFFRNAIVTVVVHALPTGPSARASFAVGAPNVTAPPDDIPPSVR